VGEGKKGGEVSLISQTAWSASCEGRKKKGKKRGEKTVKRGRKKTGKNTGFFSSYHPTRIRSFSEKKGKKKKQGRRRTADKEREKRPRLPV